MEEETVHNQRYQVSETENEGVLKRRHEGEMVEQHTVERQIVYETHGG